MNDGGRFNRIERLGRILDSAVTIPGTTVRVGLDPILGLFPGIGDGLSSFLGGVILYEAARAGTPKRYLLRMLGNVILDALVGAVPILGDIFDFAYRANNRNVDLLRSIPLDDFVAPRDSRSIGTLVGVLLLTILGLILVGAGYIVHAIYSAVVS